MLRTRNTFRMLFFVCVAVVVVASSNVAYCQCDRKVQQVSARPGTPWDVNCAYSATFEQPATVIRQAQYTPLQGQIQSFVTGPWTNCGTAATLNITGTGKCAYTTVVCEPMFDAAAGGNLYGDGDNDMCVTAGVTKRKFVSGGGGGCEDDGRTVANVYVSGCRCSALPPVPCPSGSVSVSPSSITVGAYATASPPTSNWYGGSFTSSNSSVASVTSGGTVSGTSAGTAQISGSGWNVSTPTGIAAGCSLDGASVTVTPSTACNRRCGNGACIDNMTCTSPLLPSCCLNSGGEIPCCVGSPIVVDTAGEGVLLTDAERGVWLTPIAGSAPVRISWTQPGTSNAWLVLDRNQNGLIDDLTEFFGNAAAQPEGSERNGFRALAVFDRTENGGNENGKIDPGDSVFWNLRLWIDRNHDGRSETDELYELPELGVTAIDLDYTTSGLVDQYGNQFRYSARVWDRAKKTSPVAYDVFLRTTEEPR